MFTPGPWEYRVDPDLDDNIAGPNSEQLARVYCTDTDTGMANARLIAAAPEMFSALVAALPLVEDAAMFMKDDFKPGYLAGIVKTMRSAIAKAEGE